MSECVSAQLRFITEKKSLTKLHLLHSQNRHIQTRNNIYVTGHMTGSDATTVKYENTLS